MCVWNPIDIHLQELDEEMLKFDSEIGDLDIDALLDSEDFAS